MLHGGSATAVDEAEPISSCNEPADMLRGRNLRFIGLEYWAVEVVEGVFSLVEAWLL